MQVYHDIHTFLPYSRQMLLKDTQACVSYAMSLMLAHVGNIYTVGRAMKVLQNFLQNQCTCSVQFGTRIAYYKGQMLRGYIKFEKSEEIIDVGVYWQCWFVAHFVTQIFSTFVGLILNTNVTVCDVSGLPVVSLLCRSRGSRFCHCMLCEYVHTNSYKKFSKCKI